MPWANCLDEIYWKKHWEVDAPALGEMMGFDEGDHSTLLPDEYSGKKYTHHPLALVYELQKDPFFRHLTLEQIVEAVYAEAVNRSCRGFRLQNIEVNPIATKYGVAVGCGMSCFACNNMIFEAKGIKKDRLAPHSRWEFMDGPLKKMASNQFQLYRLIVGGCVEREYHLPAFCEDCFALTKKIPDNRHWRYDETNALRSLIIILEKLNDRTHGPQQRRSRRERTGRNPDRRTRLCGEA